MTFYSLIEFCHFKIMFSFLKKLVAVLLAIWLPLFSGNALAASVPMQMANGNCHPVVAQSNKHALHHDTALHHQVSPHDGQTASSQSHATVQQDQQNSSCKDCSVCHFACSGYLVTAAIDASEILLSSQKYHASPVLFQSYSSVPLDPPPLSRV
jgi:hypothetical protein